MTSDINCLHLCSDFAKQSLYRQLFRSLASSEIRQTMFTAVRTSEEYEYINSVRDENISYRSALKLKKRHRIFFGTKIRLAFKELKKSISLKNFDICHAHFLYSDGALALRIKQQFGIPYIVAVRNTDLNIFMKYRPDLNGVRKKIVAEAGNIVFLSPSYRDSFMNMLSKTERQRIEAKVLVIPNGISTDWLQNDIPKRKLPHRGKVRLLYIGDFTPNKNIPNLIEAIELARNKLDVTLTIVGGGGGDTALDSLILEKQHFVVNLGKISDRTELREIIQQHDIFAMVSRLETFGLVYIEALSQGVPIIYSQGQAVDGYFESDKFAISVNPEDPVDIANSIQNMADRIPFEVSLLRTRIARMNWESIANQYITHYQKIASNDELCHSP